MSETKEIEIWQFQRKSFIHWRPPFLSDDPPQFVSRDDKQRLNKLNDYQLNEAFTFDTEDKWKIHTEWIYSDHFHSIKWSQNEFSSSHLCRKRCWKRTAKKKQFDSKSITNISIINHKAWNPHQNTMYYEYIIHEIEIYESSKWKPYKNGWFDVEMKPLTHIETPFDIKLHSLNSSINYSPSNGIWKWAEHWCCIDPLNTNDDIHSLSITNDIIEEYEDKMEEKIQEKKEKKKRIRIKKNAKKLFKKMRGNNDKMDQNDENKEKGDSIQKKEIDLLSTNEKNELFELFGGIDRGWEYCIKFSVDDNDWNPQFNIISQCNYRRRTWIRGAIYDVSISYNNNNDYILPALSISESLSQSILKSKSKANDLIAMIDDYLKNGNIRSDIDKKEENEEEKEGSQGNDCDNIATFIMREILNGLLWHIHLCSISNVVDRLPHDDECNIIGKLYFMEDIGLRRERINDFITSLKGLQFNYNDLMMNNVINESQDLIHKIYGNLLCDLLYECSFHETKEIYSNSQRISLINRINEVIVLYSILKRKRHNLCIITELICIISCIIGFIDKANKDNDDDDDDINPLWIFDDLLNIGEQFNDATSFESSSLFFPDLLTNLKQCIYILNKENKDKISKINRKLCSNITKRMLAILESYFKRLHDNIRPKTVVQLLQIFISLTNLYEEMIQKTRKTTFKELRLFLSEYHKLSIQKAMDQITSDNNILSMFSMSSDAKSTISSSDDLYIIKQYETDTKHKEYYDDKRLMHHFSNVSVQNIYWQYIEDILHLIDIDYQVSIALWKGNIFCDIPLNGIKCLATKCGKEFAESFKMNPHSLDISYKLLLKGAHQIQDKFEIIYNKMHKETKEKDIIDICGIFSFVEYQICIRLNHWMDLSINRIAIWIKRSAEKQLIGDVFITDSFTFINNELDVFFDHLTSFPWEGMVIANVLFQRLQVLIETIVHLTEIRRRDCTASDDNIEGIKNKTKINKGNQSMDIFLKESSIKQQHILDKFKEMNNDELFGLKCITEYVLNTKSLYDIHSDVQRIEDEEFDLELKFFCVKFSSLSRSMEIIHELSAHLLNKIQSIPSPKEEIFANKFESNKEKLVKSTYEFSTNCANEIQKCIDRSVHYIVYQLLSVQNVSYFKFKLYLFGSISSTTAIKIGLFCRIAHYMNICSDDLRECDLQIIVGEIALRFCLFMKEVLISKERVFSKECDTKYIVKDFEESVKLFNDFGLNQIGTNHENHPFYPYFECVENMKLTTLSLMQKHMVLMANRNEERKKELYKYKDQRKRENVRSLSNGSNYRSQRTKAILDKAVIRKIYDSIILDVLAHRFDDEAALSYVSNFVQYRHRNKLLIDLSSICNTLRIIIHQGKDLPPPYSKGKCDPFCIVNVMSFKLKKETRVIRETLNPKWDQALDFKIRKVTQHIIIEFDVCDWDYHIGKYTERIEYGQNNVNEKWVYLYNNDNNKVNGRLLISIQCKNLWNQR